MSNSHIRQRWVLCVVVALTCITCASAWWFHRGRDAPSRRKDLTDLTHPYPPGRWRLAPATELDRVVLYVSHILVRHRGTPRSDPPFAAIGWNIQPPAPQRTRAQALTIARHVAELARRAPNEFAELARSYSDDALTSSAGGSLGGITAAQFVREPQVLDALASLSFGHTSEVIETDYGFHVFLRREPPRQQQLAARRIVIGYETAPWLRYQARSSERPQRTHDQARALAAALCARLQHRPAEFPALVAAHSEAADAADGGDIGVWSNREPSVLARELEAVGALSEGEVSKPIDSAIGFEILQRTAVVERPTYGMSAIKLHYEPDAPDGHSESKLAVMRVAQSLLTLVRQQPSAFADLQKQYCCRSNDRWTSGRGDRALTRQMDATPMGELAAEVVAVDPNWIIARRIPPPPAREPLLELPEPLAPDLDYLVRNVNPKLLARVTRDIGKDVRDSLGLSVLQNQALDDVYDRLANGFEASPSADQRAEQLAAVLPILRKTLGDEGYDRCLRLINDRVTRQLLVN